MFIIFDLLNGTEEVVKDELDEDEEDFKRPKRRRHPALEPELQIVPADPGRKPALPIPGCP